ncbi:MAG: hypothetical protein IMX02_07585 [Limnochordaceae bacterium]|nr:hypothetical protein [Limnochordaceae bacterium]
MSDLLVGIDIGTTATKAVVIGTDGRILADAAAPSTLLSPRPGLAEEDPQAWWDNLRTVIPTCLDKAGRKPRDVAAVGVSGMVPTLIILGRDGRVLRPSIQQNDAR